MFKLDSEKTKEPEIKLPTFFGSWRKEGNSRKTSTSALLSMLKVLTVLGYTCLFQFWFPQCICPAVGLLSHMEVLFEGFLFLFFVSF